MITQPAAQGIDRQAAQTIQLLTRLLGEPRGFTVRLWNGTTLAPAEPSRFTLVLNHPGALRRMLIPPTDLTVGEAYIRGDFEVEGDLEAAMAEGVRAVTGARPWWEWGALVAQALALPRAGPAAPAVPRARLSGQVHSLRRDRAAVTYHYDVGNEFYALWLDRRMVYSCAYFPTGTEELDAAQEAKLEHICRKLRLRPGERLLDIGCGWGSLVMYAAERFGVEALGVTLSEPQARLARDRIAAAGLEDRCRVEVRDYREVREGPFDKIVSVGMFEHVGRGRMAEYFGRAWALLRPGGLFLNHGIAGNPTPPVWRRLGRWASFINAYVFPDGDLIPVGHALGLAQAAGFEVRDVEGLREHYARTLRLWVQRLEARRAEATALVGKGRYRTWRLFMAGSANGFAANRISVFQALLARPETSGAVALPWSRADIYAAARPGPTSE